MKIFIITVGIVGLIYALHRLALYAEGRGWLFYRTRPPRVRMLGLLEELVDPRAEYQIVEESAEAIRADQADSGDGYRDRNESG